MAFNTAHFSRMPSTRKPHTRFRKPFTHAGTMMHGDIVPIYAKYFAPGDIINETIVGNIRMSTPIAPLYSSIKVSFNAFFIPLRLVWANCKKFFGENDQSGPQGTTYYVPGRQLNTADTHTQVLQGSLSHYLGKPLYKGSSIDSAASTDSSIGNRVSILKERAYWLTISEWYRSEQIENAYQVADDDSDKIFFSALGNYGSFGQACEKTNKDFDYFTTCTVSPTYSATPVTMPLAPSTSYAPVMLSDYAHDMTDGVNTRFLEFDLQSGSISGLSSQMLGIYNRSSAASNGGWVNAGGSTGGSYNSANNVTGSNLVAKLSVAAQASIEELYLAMAAEAWYHNANFGSRYFEMLQVHYGVTNPDLVLNRPEHIGEKKIFLNMHQVLSTAGATSDASTKLGQPGANSSTDFKFNLFNKSFGEWGIVLILASTYHERYYSAGVDREDTYRELFDFYFPEFANIGDQAVRKSEIFYSSGAGNNNDGAFGYQEAWAEMRYSNNRLSGLLDPYAEASVNGSSNALAGWTLGEKWSTAPLLNKTFIKENRDAIEDVLVSGPTGPDYLFYFYFDEKATRELPLYSVPGLPGRGRGII